MFLTNDGALFDWFFLMSDLFPETENNILVHSHNLYNNEDTSRAMIVLGSGSEYEDWSGFVKLLLLKNKHTQSV